MGSEQWRRAQESLTGLEKINISTMDSIIGGGKKANQVLLTRFFTAVSSVMEDIHVANKNIVSSIDNSLQLDHDACNNIDSMIVPCCGNLRELRSGHHQIIVEITVDAENCLTEEYTVCEPFCSMPRKRSFNLPSIASIEELRTPAL